MKAINAIKKNFKSLEILTMFKFLKKKSLISLLFYIMILSPDKVMANIYKLNCKNTKNVFSVIYSYKRSSAILTSVNGSKTKVKFIMGQKTNNSFKSDGVISKLKTSLVYNKETNELSMLQASLRGKNLFLKCSDPELIKEE